MKGFFFFFAPQLYVSNMLHLVPIKRWVMDGTQVALPRNRRGPDIYCWVTVPQHELQSLEGGGASTMAWKAVFDGINWAAPG